MKYIIYAYVNEDKNFIILEEEDLEEKKKIIKN